MVPEGDTESGHREKAKVNETQSRRRWFKGGLANSEWGQPEREEAGSGKAGSTWVLQVGDMPTLENTEDMGLMGEEDGLELCSKIRQTTTEKTRALGGPQWASVARLGTPPPPRLQHHPQSGKRKCFWRRSPVASPRGSAFPSAEAFQRIASSGSSLSVQPLSTTTTHSPALSALAAPCPPCLPPFPAFPADPEALPASDSGPARPSGPLPPPARGGSAGDGLHPAAATSRQPAGGAGGG